jgi:hypothetical protein
MVDEMIKYPKDKHSLCYIISHTGNFIIPLNRVLGKSRYQRDLNHLLLVKKNNGTMKKKRKRGRNKITEESIKVMQQNTTTRSSKQQLYRVAESGC